MKTLSLLIPTIKSRKHLLNRLYDHLQPQLTTEVEVLIEEDDGEAQIGHKRNLLLKRAQGEYVAFIDDDDLVSPNYVHSILTALESRPDVVGFKLGRYSNGEYKGYTVLSTTEAAKDPDQVGFSINLSQPSKLLHRTIHLNPTKRSIALLYEFQNTSAGEDIAWANKIASHIKSEVYVDEILYNYHWVAHNLRNENSVMSRQRQVLVTLGIIDEENNLL